jgi:hypothetical protein
LGLGVASAFKEQNSIRPLFVAHTSNEDGYDASEKKKETDKKKKDQFHVVDHTVCR